MIRLSTLAVAAAWLGVAAPALAQDRIEVGVLECRGSTTSFVVGSVTELGCVYRPGDGGPPRPYNATMRRLGVDVGFNQQVAIVWGVYAPSRGSPSFDLAGSYAGAAASATVGVGVGANALIGGSNRTIALQPASAQAQTGLSAAAGVASLELRPGR